MSEILDEAALEDCRQVLNQVCTCGCRGTGSFKEDELSGSDLTSLEQHEKELCDELATVRERIAELKSESE